VEFLSLDFLRPDFSKIESKGVDLKGGITAATYLVLLVLFCDDDYLS